MAKDIFQYLLAKPMASFSGLGPRLLRIPLGCLPLSFGGGVWGGGWWYFHWLRVKKPWTFQILGCENNSKNPLQICVLEGILQYLLHYLSMLSICSMLGTRCLLKTSVLLRCFFFAYQKRLVSTPPRNGNHDVWHWDLQVGFWMAKAASTRQGLLSGHSLDWP